jgi:hypothetical protein
VNLLIIGGLLAVGILAILGAVLLGMSEQRAEKARKNAGPLPVFSANRNPTVKLRPLEEPVNRQPVATETTLAALEGDQAPTTLNGQFNELAGEIRSLHQQAQSLEQRLGALTETINHIERSRNNHTNIEEESHISSDHAIN